MIYTGCIYAHVLHVPESKQNGWMYIGQASDVNKRWTKKENAYKDCTFIYREMNKYGWNAFDHIIIEDNIPDSKLNEREAYWIAKYHTCQYDPDYNGGFNLTFGGDGTRGPKPSLQGKIPKNITALTEMKYKTVACLNDGIIDGIPYEKNQTWNSLIECSEYFQKPYSWVQHRIASEWIIITGPALTYANNPINYDETLIEKRVQELKDIQRQNGILRGELHKTGSRIDYNVLCVETGEIFTKVSDCLRCFNMGRATLNGHLVHPEIHKTAKGFHFKRIPKTDTNG